jgi:hypothetical protein
MSHSPKNGHFADADRQHSADSGEDTLRLIAGLPAPEGLAERVQGGLRNAPQAGRMLRWRGPLMSPGGWMHSSVARGAAAAAIVCVVAGGGWTVYSRVSPASTAKVIEMRQGVGANRGGFAPAEAKRLPETLQGPVLSHPVASPPDQPSVDRVPAASEPGQPGAVPKKRTPSRKVVAPAP